MEKLINEKFTQHDSALTKHDTEIKNLSEVVFKMDKKIDTINTNISKMNNDLLTYTAGLDKEVGRINIELHELNHEVDKRVTALESRIETIKWGFGAVVVVLAILDFFIKYLI